MTDEASPGDDRGEPAARAQSLRATYLARIIFGALALVTVAIFLLGLPARLAQLLQLTPSQQSALQQLGLGPGAYAAYHLSFELFTFFGYALVALLISWRRFDDPFALFAALNLILFGASFPPIVDALSAQPDWRLPVNLLIGLGLAFNLVLAFVFPSGRFVPAWTRGVAALWVGWNLLWPFVPALNPFAWPTVLYVAIYGGVYGIGVWAQVYRYRHVSNRVQKQQTKWTVYGLIVTFVALFGYRLLPVLFPHLVESGLPALEFDLARKLLVTAAALVVPVAFAFAILRFRLWEIDLIINRTFVYVPLTAILAGLFAASITFSQRLFVALTGQQSDAAVVITTLLVVAAVTPMKDHLQRVVDRHFKEAPESIKRLTVFGDHIKGRVTNVQAPQITRRLLEEAALAFAVKTGAAYLDTAGEMKLVDTVGDWNGQAVLTIPVQADDGGKCWGLLQLGERERGLDYSPRERQSLHEIASLVAQAIEKDDPGADGARPQPS